MIPDTPLSFSWSEVLRTGLSILPYFVMLLAALAVVALFVSLKSEFRIKGKQERMRVDRELKRLHELLRRLDPARAASPTPAASPAVPVPIPAPVTAPAPAAFPAAAFDINRRMQAMQRLRQGESVAHIAEVLGVSHRQVELLIRVQQISAEAVGQIPVLNDAANAAESQNFPNQIPDNASPATNLIPNPDPGLTKSAAAGADSSSHLDTEPIERAPTFPSVDLSDRTRLAPTIRHIAAPSIFPVARGSIRRRNAATFDE